MSAIRVGVKGGNFGADAARLLEVAERADAAGFDSIWFTDRLVTPERVAVPYPYSPSGVVPWQPTTPFVDAVVAMAMAAARTVRITVASGVLVAPLREPVALAKQVASLAALCPGRVVLGIGAGWLREEFELLELSYEDRGARTEEMVRVLRALWRGSPPPLPGDRFALPEGVHQYPVPPRPVPVLVGGGSAPALRRAGSAGDGWYGLASVDDLDVSAVARTVDAVRLHARAAGRTGADLHLVLRVAGPAAEVARRVPDLREAGITEVVVDVDWDGPGEPERTLEGLRRAGGAP